MQARLLRRQHGASPALALTAVFVAWKLVLLAVALGAGVGPSYDTSTELILQAEVVGPDAGLPRSGWWEELVTRLTRWDAIYFVNVAHRGYRFEQEWAFGSGLPVVIAAVVKGLQKLHLVGGSPTLAQIGLVGVAVANVSHLLSVLVLYRLGTVVLERRLDGPSSPDVAFVAALLHVLSPAGLFLSAPNAESSFALLSFAGYLAFAAALLGTAGASKSSSLAAPSSASSSKAASSKLARPAAGAGDVTPSRSAILVVLAGGCFGLATAFRSNGILSGVLFAASLLEQVWDALVTRSRPLNAAALQMMLALTVGGCTVAAGSAVPQFVAWKEFCSESSGTAGTSTAAMAALHNRRPWCDSLLPSIYTFVQQYYWNTGFLRYWTLSNLPLFALATPMVLVLLKSGADALRNPSDLAGKPHVSDVRGISSRLIQRMALAQVVLAVLAVTSYHVQIITRISSGYPVWYWWLATQLVSGREGLARGILIFMVMYAMIQGALFASFLPPA